LATALQKFLEIYAVIPSKFLLCLAQSMKISLRKELCKRPIVELKIVKLEIKNFYDSN